VSDVYRPLFAMVEAIEAEAKRLLEPPPALPTARPRATLSDYERVLRQRYADTSLHIARRDRDRAIDIGHRCKVCRQSHRSRIDERAVISAEMSGMSAVCDLLIDSIDAMLAAPCDIELRSL